MFQPTHPHGVRLRRKLSSRPFFLFQPTHPHGVRLYLSLRGKNTILAFQPTHPHGVRRSIIADETDVYPVSTHAPARGATATPKVVTGLDELFQPTHPHGVRHPMDNPRVQLLLGFNPRTRTGCDHYSPINEVRRDVSTHAPARGATPWPDG